MLSKPDAGLPGQHPSGEVAISVRDVSKKFRLFDNPGDRLKEALHPLRKVYHRDFWALQDVSFDIRKGEIVGILGRNGSGKSTLLQMICGIMKPTAGQVETQGRISALLELGAGFNPEFSGRDNVILNGAIMGFGTDEMKERMPQIEAFADVGHYFDQPVKTYSSGMFVRVAFAAAINIDPEILVVDEALSVGDAKFQHRCFERIRQFMEQGKTILVVSHSTDALLRICNRGIVLDQGTLRFVGPITDAVNRYQEMLFGAAKAVTASVPMERTERWGAIAAPTDDLFAPPDLVDRVHTRPGYNVYETRMGTREVQILDYELVVDGQTGKAEIAPGETVRLRVKLGFRNGKDSISVGFGLVTIDGIMIFGTNFHMSGRPLISGAAGEIVVVTFEFTSSVAGGEYFLNIGCNHIANGDEVFMDVRRSLVKLKFAQTPAIAGFVNLDPKSEVLRHSALKEIGH